MSLNAGLTDDRSLMPSRGLNCGTNPRSPTLQVPEQTPGRFPGNCLEPLGCAFSFEPDGYGEIVSLATSFPSLTLPKASTHLARLPTRFSRACRARWRCRPGCRCKVQGARCEVHVQMQVQIQARFDTLSSASKRNYHQDRSLFRRSWVLPPWPTSSPSLARSLASPCFPPLELQSFSRSLQQRWLSRLSCFHSHGWQAHTRNVTAEVVVIP